MGLGELHMGDSWMFQNTSESVQVQKLGLNIFIQTDRPIYKPGQTSMLNDFVFCYTYFNIQRVFKQYIKMRESGKFFSKNKSWKSLEHNFRI